MSRKTVTVDMLEHTPAKAVQENVVNATCGKAGTYESVVYCSACNAELSREIMTVDALDHTVGEIVIEDEIAADCTNTGSYTEIVYCSLCGEEMSRVTVTVPATGHTEVLVPGKAPSCDKEGITSSTYCSICHEVIVPAETVAKLEHVNVRIPGYAATCTEVGRTDALQCKLCGTVTTPAQIIDTVPHTEVSVPGKDATCTETGLRQGAKCSVCGVTIIEQEIAPKKSHDLGEWTVDKQPQPGVAGSKHATCADCGKVVTKSIAPLATEPDTEPVTTTPAEEADLTGWILVGGLGALVLGGGTAAILAWYFKRKE